MAGTFAVEDVADVRSAKNKSAKGGGNVEIGLWGARGAPGRIETRFGCALDAEEIDTPSCGWIE